VWGLCTTEMCSSASVRALQSTVFDLSKPLAKKMMFDRPLSIAAPGQPLLSSVDPCNQRGLAVSFFSSQKAVQKAILPIRQPGHQSRACSGSR
jgi:hypothetical protein